MRQRGSEAVCQQVAPDADDYLRLIQKMARVGRKIVEIGASLLSY